MAFRSWFRSSFSVLGFVADTGLFICRFYFECALKSGGRQAYQDLATESLQIAGQDDFPDVAARRTTTHRNHHSKSEPCGCVKGEIAILRAERTWCKGFGLFKGSITL